MLGKLIALIALRRSSPLSSAFLTRAMSSVSVVLTLSLVVAFLASVLLAGLICLSYNLMIVNGVPHNSALEILAIACLVVLLILVAVIIQTVKKIKILIGEMMVAENPVAKRVSNIVYSFLDGLLS